MKALNNFLFLYFLFFKHTKGQVSHLFSRISEKEEKEEKENKENKENLEDVHTSNQMDTLACIHPLLALKSHHWHTAQSFWGICLTLFSNTSKPCPIFSLMILSYDVGVLIQICCDCETSAPLESNS